MLLNIEELGNFPFTSRNQRIVHHYRQYVSGISQKKGQVKERINVFVLDVSPQNALNPVWQY